MNHGYSKASSCLMHGTKHGSSCIARGYADGAHPYNVGTVSTVIRLQAGDHIYAQHETGMLHSGTPARYTYLAGFLIQKTD